MHLHQGDVGRLAHDEVFDVAVLGAGNAGLSAALFAALNGQRVLVVERTAWVGGTSAWSAGTTWVPGTHHAAQVNPHDALDQAERYLDTVVGPRSPSVVRRAFLQAGARAVQRLEQHTQVRYRPYPLHPDYEADQPGATLSGRALEPLPFDGRSLGPLFGLLRPPIPEFTVLGGMMVDRTDIHHLLAMTRSWASFRHALRLIGRHVLDRMTHPRGTRLVMGNALIARQLASLARLPNVTLLTQAHTSALHRGPQGVDGLTVEAGGHSRRMGVKAGVVLASGGFNRHAQRRAQYLPGADIAWCPGAPGHTGELHDLVQGLGGVYGQGAWSPAFWAPVSLRQRADGSTAVFPHFVLDRAKPGFVTVDAQGRRFVNESTSYHRFALAMQGQGDRPGAHRVVPAWLITDQASLRRYGMGMVRPGGGGLNGFVNEGYLTCADTLAALAQRLGMDARTLQDTVDTLNRHAQDGQDPDFQRGTTAYQRNIGDATRGLPNPNLGPIGPGPFYALKLYPGDIGAAMGWACNEHAQVLNAQGEPIGGLYAVGNDMHSIMGGVYPAPGITLGPGLVFAYLAAEHMSGR